eukprot:5931972-Alexandrium_andersonii.AAC.1
MTLSRHVAREVRCSTPPSLTARGGSLATQGRNAAPEKEARESAPVGHHPRVPTSTSTSGRTLSARAAGSTSSAGLR